MDRSVEAVLEAQGLTVQYPRAQSKALHKVSMSLVPGQVLGVVGPNGSGKSTLLKAVTGMVKTEEGVVRLCGHPLEALSRREVARNLTYVPQELPADVPFTVREIVLTGRHPYLNLLALEGRKDFERVEEALDMVDALSLADRRVDSLSGGERQRVFIARGLAATPKVLLLDEPTAHLDLGHRVDLGGRLRDLAKNQGVAILVVHHDLNLAADTCPDLCLMKEGRVLAFGPAKDVFTSEHLEAAYHWPLEIDINPVTGAPRVTAIPRNH